MKLKIFYLNHIDVEEKFNKFFDDSETKNEGKVIVQTKVENYRLLIFYVEGTEEYENPYGVPFFINTEDLDTQH